MTTTPQTSAGHRPGRAWYAGGAILATAAGAGVGHLVAVKGATEREFLIGPSKQIRDIVGLVHRVAGLSATVLILGESGTGKELLARMLHRESGRSSAPFIAVNVSAIPSELVESTLFGHERGAFTGAHRQQLGKFELAAGGTLFLDEIGDLKLDLQAKLLRAIQEGEIERVGGSKPIRTNFRLVAATKSRPKGARPWDDELADPNDPLARYGLSE